MKSKTKSAPKAKRKKHRDINAAQSTSIVKVYPKSILPFEGLRDYLEKTAVAVRKLRTLAALVEKIGAGDYVQDEAQKTYNLVAGLLPMDLVELGKGITSGGPKKRLNDSERKTQKLIKDCLKTLGAVGTVDCKESASLLRGQADELERIWGLNKSEKTKSIEAKPIPYGGEPPDPGFVLERMRLDDERFEDDCQRNFQQLQSWIADDNKRDLLYKLTDKGFQEAQDRQRGRRWPILSGRKKVDIAKDLSQAVCILFAFYDHYQGHKDLISPEMRVEYGAVLGELREDVSYYFGQAPQDEVDLFTRCMVQVKQHIGSDGTVSKKPKDEKLKRLIKQKVTTEPQVSQRWEIPWSDDSNYMYASEAIVKFTSGKMPGPKLSKLLKPNGIISVHYMRKGRRCKVHIIDFIEYAKREYPTDDKLAEFTDEYIADIEARKHQEHSKNTNK